LMKALGFIKNHILLITKFILIFLRLCEHVNNMYSFSLLLNFLMASGQICFIAFQVTESTIEVILIYCIFLMTSMVQVFLVCYYGDALIAAVRRYSHLIRS